MPKAQVGGVKLYYEETGQGFPLVFCHEFAGGYESWEAQVKFFSRSYRVVTYNARGYPPSDVPSEQESYSQEQAVEDLHGLLRHLGIDSAYICGLSMGGNVALNFGIAYPEGTKALVVAGTGTGSTEPERFRREVEELAQRLEAHGMGQWPTTPAALTEYSYCVRIQRPGPILTVFSRTTRSWALP